MSLMSVMLRPPPWHMPLIASSDDLRAALELRRTAAGRCRRSRGRSAARPRASRPSRRRRRSTSPVAGDHEDVDVGIALGEHRRLLEAVVHLDGERVAALGPVDDDAQHAVAAGGAQVARSRGRRRSSSWRVALPGLAARAPAAADARRRVGPAATVGRGRLPAFATRRRRGRCTRRTTSRRRARLRASAAAWRNRRAPRRRVRAPASAGACCR